MWLHMTAQVWLIHTRCCFICAVCVISCHPLQLLYQKFSAFETLFKLSNGFSFEIWCNTIGKNIPHLCVTNRFKPVLIILACLWCQKPFRLLLGWCGLADVLLCGAGAGQPQHKAQRPECGALIWFTFVQWEFKAAADLRAAACRKVSDHLIIPVAKV